MQRRVFALVVLLSGSAIFSAPGQNLTVTSFASYAGQSTILLQVPGDVIFSGGNLTLPALPPGTPSGQLLVQAGNNILIADHAGISAGTGWTVSFVAGANPASPGNAVPGTGNVSLQGSATLATINGSIGIVAGNGVTVGTGFIHTTGGGNLQVTALTGGVLTGTRADGFVFLANPQNPYTVDSGLGGISSAAGGDVTITAGQDIASFLPTGGVSTDGGSGAFGAAPGNVSLIAGGNVTGHYVLRNGVGTITAGLNAGLPTAQLALSLVAGSWTVEAGHDIVLQEVRNPNGIFNALGSSSAPFHHYFDYSPAASLSLSAGNAVQFTCANRPRNSGGAEQVIPSIFPDALTIRAGAGGIGIADDLLLFPAATGQLDIATTNGGSLFSTRSSGGLVQVVLSDSASRQYQGPGSFGLSDHAPVPLHLVDSQPVLCNLSGDLNGVFLGSPKPAHIVIGGNFILPGFSLQNLAPTDVSILNVNGDIVSPAAAAAQDGVINGPGALNVSAGNLSLGAFSSLRSVGPGNNPALASFGRGADLKLALRGNLLLVSNTICSLAGGAINVVAQGAINAGLPGWQNPGNAPTGIYSSAKADVSLLALGDIRINGSRVATFDGGNIRVQSFNGNVDISQPGSGATFVTEYFGNPVQTASFLVPGNGLLATTLPGSPEVPGNITVLAAQNIYLGSGAVTQFSANGSQGGNSAITIQTGGAVVTGGGGAAIIGAGSVIINSGGWVGTVLQAEANFSRLTLPAGGDAQLVVTAVGLAPFAYQWFKDGVLLPGATNDTLSLVSAQRADAGSYSVVVTNSLASVSLDIPVRVVVPQSLRLILPPSGSDLQFAFSPADGVALTDLDLPNFVVQTSDNLVDWSTASFPLATTPNGEITFSVPLGSVGQGFFRVLSQ